MLTGHEPLMHNFYVGGRLHRWASIRGMVQRYRELTKYRYAGTAPIYAARAIQTLQMLGRTEAAQVLLLEASLALGEHAHMFRDAFNLTGYYDVSTLRRPHAEAWLEQERRHPTWPTEEIKE